MNVFYQKKVFCPICKRTSGVVNLISEVNGEYYPVSRDKDQYVSEWKWKNAEWQHINPMLYSITVCPVCHYADFNQSFGKSSKSMSPHQISHIKDRVSRLTGYETRLIAQISQNYNYDIHSRNHAVASLGIILAIFYQHSLLEQDRVLPNYGLLARLYLRLSWLYREEMTHDNSSEDGVERIISQMMEELRIFNDLNVKINEHLDNIDSDSMQKIRELVAFLDSGSTQLSKRTEEILIHLDSLKKQTESEDKIILGNCCAIWKWVPRSEESAIVQAAEYYQKYCTESQSLSDHVVCQILEMVAYLFEKTGNNADRDKAMREIINLCHKQRVHYMKEMRTNITPATKTHMEKEVKKLNSYIEEISYQYKQKHIEPS